MALDLDGSSHLLPHFLSTRALALGGNIKDLLQKVLPLGKFWTDAWSLIEGCTPVSPGCKNCWLAGINSRNLPGLTPGLIDPKTRHFNGKIVCREDRLDLPLRARKPRVYSPWSDLFHEGVPERFRELAFNRMSSAKQHHFIVVTKRPQVAVPFLQRHIGRDDRQFGFQKWPLSNVTILVTMEDQQRADERAPYAMQLAAQGWRVGALCEPLLGPVDLRQITIPDEPHVRLHDCLTGYSCDTPYGYIKNNLPDPFSRGRFSWLITGGESGFGARPIHPDWVCSLRDQAQAAGVPFMFKQWGEWRPPVEGEEYDTTLGRAQKIPAFIVSPAGLVRCFDNTDEGAVMLRVGKKAAGRTLDGREWLEVPE